jgi:hypothetical protein
MKSISVNLTEPALKIDDMPFNQLNFLGGSNGTGKSFVMKLAYFMSCVLNMYFYLDKKDVINALNETFKYTIPYYTGSGTVKFIFEHDMFMEVVFDNGIITNYNTNADVLGKDLAPPKVRYLSTNTRTFVAINKYLRERKKLVGASPELTNDAFLELIIEYPLYDIDYLETIISRGTISLRSLDFSKFDFPNEKIPVSLGIDLEDCNVFVLTKEGVKKHLITYSAGEQSIINMLTANL